MIFYCLINYNNSEDTFNCLKSIPEKISEDYKVLILDNGSDEISYSKLLNLIDNNNFQISNHCFKKVLQDFKPNSLSYDDVHIIDDQEIKCEKKIFVIRSQMNLGFPRGCQNIVDILINRLNLMEEDKLLFLNNDTFISKNAIERTKNFVNKNPLSVVSPSICFEHNGKIKNWYNGGKVSKFRGSAYHLNMGEDIKLLEEFSETDFITGCFLMLKAKPFIKKEIEWFGDLFLYADDIDICESLKKKGYKLFVDKNSLIFHVVSGSQKQVKKSSLNYYTTRNRFHIIDKHFKSYTVIFYIYIIFSRVIKLIINLDMSALDGIKDGFSRKKGKR